LLEKIAPHTVSTNAVRPKPIDSTAATMIIIGQRIPAPILAPGKRHQWSAVAVLRLGALRLVIFRKTIKEIKDGVQFMRRTSRKSQFKAV
jgi:hypothetical protein